MSSSDQQAQPNGITSSVSSSDYFKAIGEQVDQVAPATTNGADPIDNDDVKPVEEIESLCMNCHENVGRSCPSPPPPPFLFSRECTRDQPIYYHRE